MSCPNCNVNSFTITRVSGAVLYNCYRASCDTSGGVNVMMGTDEIRKVFSRINPNVGFSNYRVQDTEYPFACLPHGVSAYRVTGTNFRYDSVQGRMVYTVLDNYGRGKPIAYVGKIMPHTTEGYQPKWWHYNAGVAYPYISKCLQSDNFPDVAVVVEDCISADVVARNTEADGFALLGTSLTAVHKHLLDNGYKHVVVALDRDAWAKTLSIAKETGGVGFLLRDDLKYEIKDDINKLREIVDTLPQTERDRY